MKDIDAILVKIREIDIHTNNFLEIVYRRKLHI